VLVVGSASGSQLASYAWGAGNVIFVVGTQKPLHRPIRQHGPPLEDGRALAA
jgi:hypothetical protein